ncbi:unnamed protein product [Lactuca virosa]|uniref:Uncharacterized protein n=1 Tax=Lactuca virosa TaxID=75947 RepID=A0AAU9LTB9_9ASTR|nr:unnamed protein product [Lactuca virosa]
MKTSDFLTTCTLYGVLVHVGQSSHFGHYYYFFEVIRQFKVLFLKFMVGKHRKKRFEELLIDRVPIISRGQYSNGKNNYMICRMLDDEIVRSRS